MRCGFFAFEYATGWSLRRLLGSAPWDCTYARPNLHGLIRFDSAPIWAVTGP